MSWTTGGVVLGSDLLADSDSTVAGSLTTTDAAGNTGTVNASRPYAVDQAAPALTIAIDPITGDDIISQAENAMASQTITGKVTGEFVAGDVVTLQLNDGTTSTTATGTVDVSGSWAIAISPASAFASDADLKLVATINATDNHGNTGAASTTRGYTVDLVSPQITKVDISSIPTHGVDNATYYVAGETVQTAVNFDDAVYVNGAPAINLLVGANGSPVTVTADYVSGSGTNALVFEWTVPSGTMDTDNVSVPANAISLPGTAAIKDVNGNNAVLTHLARTDEVTQKIDAVAPTATLTWASDGDLLDYATHSFGTRDETAGEDAYEVTRGQEIGIYKLGDTMYLQVQFNEQVFITNPNSMTLNIQLTPNSGYPSNIFPETRAAVFDAAHSDLATGKVVFAYTVQAGDEDSPTANGADMEGAGVEVNSLQLNGATIKDVAGNAYNLDLNSLAQDPYEYIDATAPTTTAHVRSWQDATGFYQGETQTADYGTGTDTNQFDPLTGAYVSTATGSIEGDVTTDEVNWKLNIYADTTMDTGDGVNVYAADGTFLGSVSTTTTIDGKQVYVFDDPRYGGANPAPVAGNSYGYYVKVMDIAGNEGAKSENFTITYDPDKPANYAHITAVADDTSAAVSGGAADLGNVTDGGTTNDTTLTVTGALDNALAEGHRILVYRVMNQTGTPTLTDPADSGAIGAGDCIGEVTNVTGTTWSFDDTTALTGGDHADTYSYFVKIVDDAGNFSDVSSNGAAGTNGVYDTTTGFDINIDTVAPTAILSWSSTGDLHTGVATDYATDVALGANDPSKDETAGEVAYEASTGQEIGIYKLGDTMYLNLKFSEAVTITDPGLMTLAISLTNNVGTATTVNAVYDAANSDLSKGLVSFKYVIQAGDLDSPAQNGMDGLGASVAANALSLNGAVISDAAYNGYGGTHNALAEDIHEYIDTVAPATAKIVSWQDVAGFNLRCGYRLPVVDK